MEHIEDDQASSADPTDTVDIVYLNLGGGLLWPSPAHRMACAHMQMLSWHLEYGNSIPSALHITRRELTYFLRHEPVSLMLTMYSGVWRLFADKCLHHLLNQDTDENTLLLPQGQARTLRHLQRPVTWVLSFLGIRDMHCDVTWPVDVKN